ncbi:nitrous oxide reductase accessory protein NosL [Halosolutus gelatinilyticus]|uniref:nitrous oxide reductase accessory protein NosL n=1 Tax=Halosolutus gelatinilyticus TaxID=2931975 RepID=UPI001FF12194|nr:nitrous oxide reductase accessory protein NosL [Halosolutus gelatinilyticus]
MTGFEGRPFTRRRLLGSAGAGATIAAAGCLGRFGDDGSGSADSAEDGDGRGEGDEHQYATDVEHPGGEPLEFSGDYNCPVCNMTPADYPRWQCQLAHENGQGALFDTPGCMFAYYAAPPIDSPIDGAWVTDFGSGDLVDGTDASYVLVTDSEAVPNETMGLNPRPFASYDDAVAYLDEWEAEELTEDDIVGLADVDREVAAIYRGNRLPDE